MTQFLLTTWILHFISFLERHGGIAPEQWHLLIIDGHNLHVTMDVVMKAMEVGLDLVTLPLYTSHRLQPRLWMLASLHPIRKLFENIEMHGF